MITRTLMAFITQTFFSQNRLRQLGWGLLITLPVIIYVFKFSLLNRHGIFRGEDWDYFAQSYEAARQSIVHYHQFPWWNPWVNGGQPLFANPQFGLFSLQMPLVLLFGTVAGLHISILLYFIIGFWGMYRLLQRLGSKTRLITVLLAYIWIFNGFSAWHLAGGHFTFAVYLLAPWAFLSVLNIHRKWGWLRFGLIASLLIQTAMHYLTIEILIICALIAAVQLGRHTASKRLRILKAIWPLLLPYILALGLILLLCSVRLIYTFQFTREYPRLEDLDPAVSVKMLIAALTFRHAVDPGALTTQSVTHYGWTEYANYFGLLTLSLFAYLVIRRLENLKAIIMQEWSVLVATGLAVLLTLGAFASFSPYSLLHHLPLFNQMRVPSRFIAWVAFGVLIYLVRLPRKPVIYVLLALSTIDVFLASYPIFNYRQAPYKQTIQITRRFEQYEFYQTSPNLGVTRIIDLQNLRLLRATQQNYGEVYGYEPILNLAEFYFQPGTNRCGVNHGCQFVLTNNAKVTAWSPHRIELERTDAGPIKLNMNPGKVWQANGHDLFPNYKILELKKDFVITSPASKITITFHPVIR